MHFHSSVIFVQDIEISKDFYTRILKQEIEHDFGKNVSFTSGLSIWEIRPEHIIVKNLDIKKKSNRMELYFEHENIDEAFIILEKENTRFLHKILEEPWGQRTIRFFDPDDHLVEIGEPIPVFVENMKKQGMSVDQISGKSGIPVEAVRSILNS